MNREPDFSDRGQLPKRTNMWSSLGVFTGRVNFYVSLSIGETRQSAETGGKKVRSQWLARKRHRIIRCLWKHRRASFPIEQPRVTMNAWNGYASPSTSMLRWPLHPRLRIQIIEYFARENRRKEIRSMEFLRDQLSGPVSFGWVVFFHGCTDLGGWIKERNKSRMVSLNSQQDLGNSEVYGNLDWFRWNKI